MRPAAGVPYSTARGWLRRFTSRAVGLSVGFAALAVELGADVVAPIVDACCYAIAVIGAAFEAACSLPGWVRLGRRRFVSAVRGGRLLAANTNTPSLIIGRRRLMPPVP